MTDRIRMMKDKYLNDKISINITKFRIACDILSRNDGRSIAVKRAMIHERFLKEIPLFIEEGDLIVGAGCSKPNGVEINYEMGIWSDDEINGLLEDDSLYYIDPQDAKDLQRLNKEMNDVLRANNISTAMSNIVYEDKRIWAFMRSGVMLPPWKNKDSGQHGGMAQTGTGMGPGFALMCPNYPRILNSGAISVIEECKEHLNELRYTSADSVEKREFWENTIRIYRAWIEYAHRYADLAERLSETEPNIVRKKELSDMASICRRVPEFPARSFREALQSFWFTFQMFCNATTPGGRFDQFMYPFYKHDIEAGTISRDEVIEILENLRIKCMKMYTTPSSMDRGRHSGNSRWFNWILGGVDAQGNDATNDLTYLVLEAAKELKMPHHTISVRVHEKTPDELMKKSLEVVRSGLAMPNFVSDKSYIHYFTMHGVPVQDARNYVLTGCQDANVPLLTRTILVKFVIIPQMFDIYLHNGYCKLSGETIYEQKDIRGYVSFDDFLNDFYKLMDHFIGLSSEVMNINCSSLSKLCPDTFRSSLMDNSLKEGKDVLRMTLKPFDNGGCILLVGIINVANSIAAIKKLVFEEKKYSLEQLVAALDADWNGHDEMRDDFLNAPKYGNDIDYVDSIATDLFRRYGESVEEKDCSFGGKYVPGGISITSHQPGGKITGASPDGRHAGEILADGSISPQQGTDKNGPLAVFRSAMKIAQDNYQATLFNMKFSPSALKTDEDLLKLGSVIKTYLTNGGKQIQFNVVDAKTMRDAQKAPEKHRELVVRVAGYSTYFNTLTTMIQNEIIDRNEFEKV